jgi:hypothetical protein
MLRLIVAEAERAGVFPRSLSAGLVSSGRTPMRPVAEGSILGIGLSTQILGHRQLAPILRVYLVLARCPISPAGIRFERRAASTQANRDPSVCTPSRQCDFDGVNMTRAKFTIQYANVNFSAYQVEADAPMPVSELS